jgi:hypothetical protein
MGVFQFIKPEQFYKRVDASRLSLGQICQIVVPYIDKIPQILDVERHSPEEHENVKFKMRNARPGDFQSRRTLPLKGLNLRSNEEMLIQRAKRRPGIIISTGVDTYPELNRLLRQSGKAHLQEDSVFLVPCYGVQTEDSPSGFPPEMAARIRCLMYRQFFYLPKKGQLTKDSVARLDRVRVIVDPKEQMAIEPTELCLSEEAFDLLFSLFRFCLSGNCDEELVAIRQLTKDCYPELASTT